MPAPTPTSTSTPAEMTEDGNLAILAGDYETALEIFQAALSTGTDPRVVAGSNLGMARLIMHRGIMVLHWITSGLRPRQKIQSSPVVPNIFWRSPTPAWNGMMKH